MEMAADASPLHRCWKVFELCTLDFFLSDPSEVLGRGSPTVPSHTDLAFGHFDKAHSPHSRTPSAFVSRAISHSGGSEHWSLLGRLLGLKSQSPSACLTDRARERFAS